MADTHSASACLEEVSVVIPSLGGSQLRDTITQINSGTLRPKEILICIPSEEVHKVDALSADNLRVILTPRRGQVAQRAAGFSEASSPIVMQLDDDIYLARNALETMAAALVSLGQGYVVGPVFYNSLTKAPLTQMRSGIAGWASSAYETLIRGLPWGRRRMGALSSIGAGGGVDPRFCDKAVFPTSWLPGGCVLGYRGGLVFENFFPFQGKAYSEDILHSYLRSKKGIGHVVDINAHATIDPPERRVSVHGANAEVRARVYTARVLGGNSLRAVAASLLDIGRRQLIAWIKQSP